MKRIIALILGALSFAAFVPPSAEAFISTDYCAGPRGITSSPAGSLRGFGSLAPDNDALAEWNRLKTQGYSPTRSYWYGYNYVSENNLYIYWTFETAQGVSFGVTFRCYRDGGSNNGAYHDEKV